MSLRCQKESAKRIWVLREPDEIVEYDPSTFIPKQTVRVPPQALQRPDYLAVSSGGWIVFDPDPRQLECAGPPAANARIWLCDGETAAYPDCGWTRTDTPAVPHLYVLEIAPRCFPSADGRRLYWLGNGFRKLRERIYYIDMSVATPFRAWQSGPAGGGREQIAEISFSPCDCGTGFCEETCPEAEIRLSSEGKVDDAELARIRRARADLPGVEVFSLAAAPQQVARIPRAALMGWLNDREVLVMENHALVGVDFVSGLRRMSKIEVPRESHVFLR